MIEWEEFNLYGAVLPQADALTSELQCPNQENEDSVSQSARHQCEMRSCM